MWETPSEKWAWWPGGFACNCKMPVVQRLCSVHTPIPHIPTSSRERVDLCSVKQWVADILLLHDMQIVEAEKHHGE